MSNRLRTMMNELIRPGDRVVMNMDPESRMYSGSGQPPNGTYGTVTHRARYDLVRERTGYDLLHGEPGVYRQDGQVFVHWDGYEESQGSSSYDLSHADQTEYERRYQDDWVGPVLERKQVDRWVQSDRLLHCIRTGPLPETAYWEQDLVRWTDPIRTDFKEHVFVIERVRYDLDGSYKGHSYTIRRVDPETREDMHTGSWSNIREADLELVERGNVWNHYHHLPKVFRSLREEAEFASLMLQVADVPNPATQLYAWTKDELLDAISAGIIDGFTVSGGLFGSDLIHSGHRFKDRDLGERVRIETLVGFGLASKIEDREHATSP